VLVVNTTILSAKKASFHCVMDIYLGELLAPAAGVAG
jgi:hypothetical protein